MTSDEAKMDSPRSIHELPPATQFVAQNTPHNLPQNGPSKEPTPRLSPPLQYGPLQPPKERTRHSSACYPCAKRKVKCDRDIKQPCSNCARRSQGDACVVKNGKERSALHSSGSGPPRRSAAAEIESRYLNGPVDPYDDMDAHRDKRSRYVSFQNTFRSTPQSQKKSRQSLGDEREYAPLSNHSSRSADAYRDDREPILLASLNDHSRHSDGTPPMRRQSLSAQLPHHIRGTSGDPRWDEIVRLLPPRKDLLKYIGTYRMGPHIVNPIVADFDKFESQVCGYLEDLETPRMQQQLAGSDKRASEVALGTTALILAVLASGARYQDTEDRNQLAVSREYTRRAFACLQLASYMLRPSLDAVKALLVLTNNIANDNQPGAAWGLLATTIRLAQILNLDAVPAWGRDENNADYRNDCAATWSALVMQDTVFSICFERPSAIPLSSRPRSSTWPNGDGEGDKLKTLNTYSDCVRALCAPTLAALDGPAVRSREVRELENHIEDVRSVLRHFGSHSSGDHKGMKDRYERASMNVHAAAAEVYMHTRIRDALNSPSATKESPWQDSGDLALARVHADLKQACPRALDAFVDFCAISNVPVRTWSMVNLAVRAALDLLAPPRTDPDVAKAVRRLLDAFPRDVFDAYEGWDAIVSLNHARAIGAAIQILDSDAGHGERADQLRAQLPDLRAHLTAPMTQDGWMPLQAVWGL